MAKFFVIDQSLESAGGHHFDMVRLIAESASRRGFDVEIGANCSWSKSAGQNDSLPHIHPVFRHTTYTPYSQLGALQEATRSRLSWTPLAPGNRGANDYATVWGDSRSITSYFQAALKPIVRGLRRLHPVNLRRLWRNWKLEAGQNRIVDQFARDCAKLFDGHTFREGDHVLFVTMNEVDFMGLAAFLANHPETLTAHWHIVFHFGVFAGHPPPLVDQKYFVGRIRYSMQAALARIPYHQVTLFTSTEELADQYNQLRVGYFEMLPYPIDSAFGRASTQRRPEKPLQLTLAGGLRREKGKQAVERLLKDLGELNEEGKRVQLVLQKRKRKWHQAADIRLRLPPSQADLVRTVPHPLPANAYRELIEQTDIGLLLYNARAYYARRAGVLCEYLAAGRPVVVPAGCWLGHQLASYAYRHVERLIEQRSVSPARELTSYEHSRDNVPLPGNVISFDRSRHPFSIRGDLPAPCSALAIQFNWLWPTQPGIYAQVTFRGWDDGGHLLVSARRILGHRSHGASVDVAVSDLFQVPPDTQTIEMTFTNAYEDSMASLRDVQLTPIGAPGEAIPRSAVGVRFADYFDVKDAIREIIEHYPHYASTAAQQQTAWQRRHDPDYALDFMLDSVSPLRSVA